jgi:hypothetical protein
MIKFERLYFDRVIFCGKGQKEGERVAVSFYGIFTYPKNMGEIPTEKLMDTNR